jgi:hypothetical protein
VIDRLRASLQAAIGNSRADLDPENQETGDRDREVPAEHQVRRDLVAAENAELARLFADGTITAATRQRLQRGLDLEIARLAEREP